jgi:hypothetical protein
MQPRLLSQLRLDQLPRLREAELITAAFQVLRQSIERNRSSIIFAALAALLRYNLIRLVQHQLLGRRLTPLARQTVLARFEHVVEPLRLCLRIRPEREQVLAERMDDSYITGSW